MNKQEENSQFLLLYLVWDFRLIWYEPVTSSASNDISEFGFFFLILIISRYFDYHCLNAIDCLIFLVNLLCAFDALFIIVGNFTSIAATHHRTIGWTRSIHFDFFCHYSRYSDEWKKASGWWQMNNNFDQFEKSEQCSMTFQFLLPSWICLAFIGHFINRTEQIAEERTKIIMEKRKIWMLTILVDKSMKKNKRQMIKQ